MFVGFIFLIVGVMYFLEVLVPGFNINYKIIWPIALMVISIYFMIKDKRVSFWTLLLFFLGGWALLFNMNILDSSYRKLFFPILLMLIGLDIIFNALSFSKQKKIINEYSVSGLLNFYGVFGGVEEKVNDKDFKGANIYSIFGGCDLDFSNIELKGDNAVITVYSIFGGSTVVVPKGGFNIIYNSTGIFGGNDNKSDVENKKGQKTIYLNCIAIFGGTEIR